MSHIRIFRQYTERFISMFNLILSFNNELIQIMLLDIFK